MNPEGNSGVDHHQWEYRAIIAFAAGSGSKRGKFQVSAGDFKETAIELYVCRRCGTVVATNTPAMAQRVARVEGIDCDDVTVRRVMES